MAHYTRLLPRSIQAAPRALTLPPAFLLPSFSAQQIANFSSTPSNEARRDRNRNRGVSALRRTGPRKSQTLSVDLANLPKPVLDPSARSEVEVDPEHGLWDFFNPERTSVATLEYQNAHGRAWTANELRNKDWEDLHRLWWVCVKERNRIATEEYERLRIKAGYGEYEADKRDREVRKTMRGIKHVLTERWYAWEEARKLAETDPEVNLYPAQGQEAFKPSYQVRFIDNYVLTIC